MKVVYGGMHTVALSSLGCVYTWGCNNDGALGRDGPENNPLPVIQLPKIFVTDIATGDSHTVVLNKSN
jgi:regulator of chromosome condensation